MSFFGADPEVWAAGRRWFAEQREAGAITRWPDFAILTDLRWHADRAMDRRGGKFAVPFPTSDELAREWGIPKSTVYRKLKAWRTWCDEGRIDDFAPIADARWHDGGTTVARSRNDGGTVGDERTETIDESRHDGGTVAERSRNESGPARALVFTDTDTDTEQTERAAQPPEADQPSATRKRKAKSAPDIAPTVSEAIDTIAEWDAPRATRLRNGTSGAMLAILDKQARRDGPGLLTVLRYVARADERDARWIRGAEGDDHPDLDALFRSTPWAAKVRDRAAAWSDSGMATPDPSAAAWSDVVRRIDASRGRVPNRPAEHGSPNGIDLAEGPAEHARRFAAMRAAGPWASWADPPKRADLRARWTAAYATPIPAGATP